MIDLPSVKRIFIYPGYTDMRCGIRSLSVKVASRFPDGELEGCLFLFCGHNRKSMKALEFTKDGTWLYQKVFRDGRFRWPRATSDGEVPQITERQIRWLLDGLEIVQKKASSEAEIPKMF